MTIYEHALKTAIENLNHVDKDNFLIFNPDDPMGIRSKTLASIGFSELRFEYFRSSFNPDLIICSLFSKETQETQIGRIKIKIHNALACLDWVLNWLSILFEESKMMKEFGFTQLNFTNHEFIGSNFVIRPSRCIANGESIIAIGNKLYALGMEQALVMYAKKHLSISQIMELNPSLRDKISNSPAL